MTQALGIDVGGVIIDRVGDKAARRGFYGESCTEAVAVPDVFSALLRLRRTSFGDDIHVVSKCGPEVEERTLRWMRYHRFFERTGIARERVHFCRTCAGKAPICERLGITHFVDDRLEVLGHLTTVPHRFLLNPQRKDLERYRQHLPHVIRVESWLEATVAIESASEIPT